VPSIECTGVSRSGVNLDGMLNTRKATQDSGILGSHSRLATAAADIAMMDEDQAENGNGVADSL
jgi:hypothetical protein